MGPKMGSAKKIFSSPYFLIKASENNCNHNRFGIIISSASVKKSTQRHFWKRRIADETKKWQNFGKDFLIIVSPKINGASANEARAALQLAEEKIK